MDDEAVMRLIAHRCDPEIADLVLPVLLLANVLEVLDAMEARIQTLTQALDAQTSRPAKKKAEPAGQKGRQRPPQGRLGPPDAITVRGASNQYSA
jgi:hypothetical protein